MKTSLLKTILIRLFELIYNPSRNEESNLKVVFLVTGYINFIQDLRKKSGLKYTISYMKAVKLHITRYICGKPLLENKAGVAVDSNGFPIRFVFLKPFLDKGHVRMILSLLTLTRGLKPSRNEEKKIEPDYSTITMPSKGTGYTIPSKFIKQWIIKNNLSLVRPVYTEESFYLSTKGSPNGPATQSSIWSPRLLNGDQLKYIFQIVNVDFHDFLSKYLDFIYLDVFNPICKDVPADKMYTGKLAIIKDPELKRRIIAMVDYLSQWVLKPIHMGILDLLKSLPQDRTFTQDPFNIWDWSNNEPFYSLDLSAATDRFPVVLQKKLLSYIYDDSNFANNWMNLLTNRKFYSKDLGYTLQYSVGQPMGAYSSWAAFTITHHLVVHYSAFLAGYDHFDQYIILGDDIVIKNDKVAQKYIGIMTKWGVAISMHKTHISKDTYEFAKRWICNGKEITGIPLKGIISNWDKPQVIYLEIFNYLQRIPISSATSLNLVCTLYNGLKWRKKRIYSFHSMERYLYDFSFAIRYTFEKVTYDELRSFISHKLKSSESMVPTEKVVPSFLKGLFGVGLAKEAATSKSKIFQSMKAFNKYFLNLHRKYKKVNKDFSILVSTYPLFQAYSNKNKLAFEKLNDFLNKPLGRDLQEIIMDIKYDDFDAVIAAHRQKSRYVECVSKLWSRAFNILYIRDPSYILEYRKELIKVLNSCKLYELEVGFFNDIARGGLMQHQFQERQLKDLLIPFIIDKREPYTPKWRIQDL